ncbi:MAG: lysophospholipid acyltransferase family protein [Gammaproteobacteria bacterium]
MSQPSAKPPPKPAGPDPSDPHESLPALLLRVVYGGWTWLVFVVVALITLLLLLVLPGMERRRHVTGIAARLILKLAGVPLTVTGIERLPPGQCMVVANHASYIDAIVVKAVLPERFAYVVKREMASVPLAGLLLERIGTEFVERFDRHKGGLDARRVLRTATSGQPLLFFPEGTFEPPPGLLRFRIGAFASAARARCPVVPCAIRGTRDILPSPLFFPRPGRVEFEVLEPLHPDPALPPERAAAVLRDAARAAILARVDEPDAATDGASREDAAGERVG